MRDLRLVGVHEDGQHVLLADSEGGRYRLTLDDALRAAARRDRPRLGQLQIELEGGLRPREVQALIRSGLSTEEVAERAGWTVEKVQRYEGPVLAERDHVAQLARGVRLRSSARSADPTLAGRVGERLTGRGVDAALAEWDAARDPEGRWSVLLRFSAGGRQRVAVWAFDVDARTVSPRDDEARWLTAEDAAESAVPLGSSPSAATLSAGAPEVEVYDVESDGGVEGAPRRHPHEPVDLMAAMRESSARGRRSRRRGHQQPTLTPVDDPASVSEAAAAEESSPASKDDPVGDDAVGEDAARDSERDASADDGAASGSGEGEASAESGSEPESDPEPQPAPDRQAGHEQPAAHRGRPRRGRPSVPRWDDVMFGARGSGSDD